MLEIDEHGEKEFNVFEAAPRDARGTPENKNPLNPDYFM
jgi:hypothetical protein